jgi:hypothetical protein
MLTGALPIDGLAIYTYFCKRFSSLERSLEKQIEKQIVYKSLGLDQRGKEQHWTCHDMYFSDEMRA